MSKKNMGSSIDDFMKKEEIFEEAQAQAIKEVVAWQLAQAMKQKKISKNRMAILLKTSRTQVDRLLDPTNDITLSSLQRAAAMVGRRVTIRRSSGRSVSEGRGSVGDDERVNMGRHGLPPSRDPTGFRSNLLIPCPIEPRNGGR
jgi:antitoxin HicB